MCLETRLLLDSTAVRSAVSSQRAPRVCLASALRACVQLARSARVRVAPARSLRAHDNQTPMLVATKSSFLHSLAGGPPTGKITTRKSRTASRQTATTRGSLSSHHQTVSQYDARTETVRRLSLFVWSLSLSGWNKRKRAAGAKINK